MTVVAAGPNCDRIRSAGAAAPSISDRQTAKLRNRQAARPPDRQTMRRPGRGFARCPCSITSAKPGQCHKGGIGMAGQAWQGQSRAEPSRANPTQPNPTQPNPTQPNPTREMQDRRIGKGTDQIAGCIQARRSFWLPGLRSGCAKRALGAGFRGGVDLSSPWRGLNCQLRADGQCVGNEY
jgi:hypothetical protein